MFVGRKRAISKICFFVSLILSTEYSMTRASAQSGELSGGAGTSFLFNKEAYRRPISNLAPNQLLYAFEISKKLFNMDIRATDDGKHAAISLFKSFNAGACSECHVRNGRGSSPRYADETLDVRLRIDELTDQGLTKPRFLVENEQPGSVSFDASGRVIRFEVAGETPVGLHSRFFGRVAPPIFGAGLIDAVSELDIQSNANRVPQVIRRRGIISNVWSSALGRYAVGRFGWKGGKATLCDQTADATAFELGVEVSTVVSDALEDPSDLIKQLPKPVCGRNDVALLDFYSRAVAVPAKRDSENFRRGAQIFDVVGCSDCHRERYKTRDDASLEMNAGQTIYPYSDFLLHDLGPDLGGAARDGEAGSHLWKTPPLWGIGLAKTVNPTAGFMHDGRAKTLDEAVRFHLGDALPVLQKYKALEISDREELLGFLNSL
jgi:CxxC motif-containing protein (DUF1111 family)